MAACFARRLGSAAAGMRALKFLNDVFLQLSALIFPPLRSVYFIVFQGIKANPQIQAAHARIATNPATAA